jgi:hypothetical protein
VKLLALALCLVCSVAAAEPLPIPPYYTSNSKVKALYDEYRRQYDELQALKALPPPAPSTFEADVREILNQLLNQRSVLVTASVANTKFTLSWTDNSTNEAGFAIERCFNNGPWVEIKRVGANVTTYVDAGLAPGEYKYRLFAYNTAGNSGFSNTATGTLQ